MCPRTRHYDPSLFFSINISFFSLLSFSLTLSFSHSFAALLDSFVFYFHSFSKFHVYRFSVFHLSYFICPFSILIINLSFSPSLSCFSFLSFFFFFCYLLLFPYQLLHDMFSLFSPSLYLNKISFFSSIKSSTFFFFLKIFPFITFNDLVGVIPP
ncbi:unnamed protein product [Acanthosepion pharaonis]|uniref:Uncharacterized protein n=1 Tax=Acanthosepion pharaonis TaxID=158019 RepID=A0A812CK84_ACAPH|nr:unnamed protein product [Sepia pharaonis]